MSCWWKLGLLVALLLQLSAGHKGAPAAHLFTIRNGGNGLNRYCVTARCHLCDAAKASGSTESVKGVVVGEDCQPDAENQRFYWNGSLIVSQALTGPDHALMCLDVEGQGGSDTQVILYKCNKTALNQQWINVTHVGGVWQALKPIHLNYSKGQPGLCLDLNEDNNTQFATAIKAINCSGDKYQQLWNLEADPSDSPSPCSIMQRVLLGIAVGVSLTAVFAVCYCICTRCKCSSTHAKSGQPQGGLPTAVLPTAAPPTAFPNVPHMGCTPHSFHSPPIHTPDEPEGRLCMGWFNQVFENRNMVHWDVFWMELDKLVHMHTEMFQDDRWEYYGHHLQVDGDKRKQFEAFISSMPGATEFSRGEWRSAVEATSSGKLCELIQLAMTSTWSHWSNSGLGHSVSYGPIIQAQAGRHIQKWNINWAYMHVQPQDDASRDQVTMLAVVSIQGQASDGNWLTQQPKPEAKMAGVWDENEHSVDEAPTGAGFSVLKGRGSWCLTSFMDSPGNYDQVWQVRADRLCVPAGRVVGYQMRTCSNAPRQGGVDSMRFLFRPFNRQNDCSPALRDAVFISHTKSDKDVHKLVSDLYGELLSRRVPAFFDAASIDSGDRWREKILKWVRLCKVVVVIISPSFPTRKWPMTEVSEILKQQQGRKIIPALFGVTRDDVGIANKPGSTSLGKKWAKSWAEGQLLDQAGNVLNPAKLLEGLMDHHQGKDKVDSGKPLKDAMSEAVEELCADVLKARCH